MEVSDIKAKIEVEKLPGKRLSNYGYQLKEKQNAKEFYGMRERQFRRFFQMASKARGNKGAMLIELLERRLDNVIFRLGWAASRRMARQLVSHRHFLVNKKIVNIPSYIVNVGDEITFRNFEKTKKIQDQVSLPKDEKSLWLEASDKSAKVRALPERNKLEVPIKENLIVELYSK